MNKFNQKIYYTACGKQVATQNTHLVSLSCSSYVIYSIGYNSVSASAQSLCLRDLEENNYPIE